MQDRHNAFNLSTVVQVMHGPADEEGEEAFSLQLLWENRRIAGPELNDPPIWTLADVPKYMPHKYPTLDPNMKIAGTFEPATSASISIHKPWAALCGWCFSIDFDSDAAGWRYATNFDASWNHTLVG